MPARFVVVHHDSEFTSALMRRFGSDLSWFDDPEKALVALTNGKTVQFLITRVQFGNQPLGLSLARLTKVARPDVKVIFTGPLEHRDYTRGIGEFVPEPASIGIIEALIGTA